MNWESIIPGLLLGFGAVLIWKGFRTLTDKSLDNDVRRRGFWPLNGGFLLVAVSIVVVMRFGG